MGMPLSSENALVEARAKIIWGEPYEEAVALLTENGFGSEQAKEHVAVFLRERAFDIRRQGIKDIVKGTGLLVVGIIPILWMLGIGYIMFKLFGILLIPVAYGTWTFITGVERILLGSKAEGSIANLK